MFVTSIPYTSSQIPQAFNKLELRIASGQWLYETDFAWVIRDVIKDMIIWLIPAKSQVVCDGDK